MLSSHKSVKWAVTAIAVVTAMMLTSAAVQADIINVPGDYPTIQAGIDAAVNGDEVVVAPGTYFENINLLGKAITVRSSDGPQLTTIDAQYFGTVVTCASGEGADTVLDGFTITRGFNTGNIGGMYNYNSSPTLNNCVFTENIAHINGGGMYNYNSSPTLNNCVFSINWVSHGGGAGMYNTVGSSPTLTNCTFSGNRNGLGGGGGGMRNVSSSPTLTNCTFSGNFAGSGGGMYNYNSSPTLNNCILWGDTPDEIVDVADATTTVTYSDVQDGWPGIGNINADPMFAHGPTGTWTDAATYDEGTDQTTFTDTNASFAPDELVGRFIDPDIAVPDLADHLKIAANTTATISIRGEWACCTQPGDKYLIYDYHLSSGSPCADAGNNWGVPIDVDDYDEDGNTAELFPVDFDGNPRFNADEADFDPGCGVPVVVDMGAYEYQFAPVDDVIFADLNGDGAVGILDLLGVLAGWGDPANNCLADLDIDGDVDILDLLTLLAHWG